jgi:hypothetical protein
VVLRTLEPVDRVVFRLNGGPEGDIVRARTSGAQASLALRPSGTGELSVAPGRAYGFYLSYVYTLTLASEGAELRELAPAGDTRALGAFVRIELKLGRFEHAPVRLGALPLSGRALAP